MPPEDNDEQEQEARDALCPNCGHGFHVYLERLAPETRAATPHPPAECPRCGCQECIIK